jgi:hypothetical protein
MCARLRRGREGGNRAGFGGLDRMPTLDLLEISRQDESHGGGNGGFAQKKAPQEAGSLRRLARAGGEGGIRTRGGITLTRFPIVRIRPDYATSPLLGSTKLLYHCCFSVPNPSAGKGLRVTEWVPWAWSTRQKIKIFSFWARKACQDLQRSGGWGTMVASGGRLWERVGRAPPKWP